MRKNEQKEQSKPCSHKNDLNYDECVYSSLGTLLQEKLGCSFQFLQTNQTSLNDGQEKECTIKDVKEKMAIQDIVYGNIELIKFCFSVEITALIY